MYDAARRIVADVMRHLYSRGLVSAFSGNVSVRVEENAMVITRSGVHRNLLTPKDTVVMSFMGRTLEGSRPSSEWKMHAAIYRVRRDVEAVVHTHPRHVVALYRAGRALRGLTEIDVFFRNGIARVERYSPGSMELATAVANALNSGVNAAVLLDHGFVAVGQDVWEAAGLTEVAEEAAQILLLSNV